MKLVVILNVNPDENVKTKMCIRDRIVAFLPLGVIVGRALAAAVFEASSGAPMHSILALSTVISTLY